MLNSTSQILAISIFLIVFAFFCLFLYRSLFTDKNVAPKINAKNNTESLQHDKREKNKSKGGKTIWKRWTENPIVFYTSWLTIFTGLLVFISAIQFGLLIRSNKEASRGAKAAETAANAAIASNEISREIMIAEQRPWITVSFNIITPLAYDDKGWDAGTRWHLTLVYELKNIGKTPATKASFMASMVPYTIPHWPKEMVKNGLPQGNPIDGTDIQKEFNKIFVFQENMIKNDLGFGQILFPGETRKVKFTLNGNNQIFDKIKKAPSGYTGHFIIIACASYGSTYNEELYCTAKAYQMFKRSGDKAISLDGDFVPIADIALAPHPIRGSYAK